MKIGFITDTNFLKKKDNKLIAHNNYLSYIDDFLNYIKDLEESDSDSKLIYYMPEIILEELYFQRITIFNNEYNLFKKKYEELSHSIIGEIPLNNINKTALEEKEKYKNSPYCKLLKLNTKKEILDELIQEALEKKAPFDKTIDDKKTDAGFKDALIWKTILYSKDIDECDKLYFFSCDKVFEESEEMLNKQFQIYHPKVKCIIKHFEPNGRQRNNALKLMIKENNLIETSVVKLHNQEIILKFIKELKYESKQEVIMQGITSNGDNIFLKNILFKNFTMEDFYIKEIEKKEENYEVNIHFKTNKYTTIPKLCGGIAKRYLFGKIKFVIQSKEENFEVIDRCLSNLKFIETPIEKMINTMKKQQEMFDLENAKFQAFNDISAAASIAHQQFKEITSPFKNIMSYDENIIEDNEEEDENNI